MVARALPLISLTVYRIVFSSRMIVHGLLPSSRESRSPPHRIASHRIALCLQSKNPPRLHMTRPTFLMTVVSSSLHPLPWASDSCISFGFPDSQVPRFIDVVQSHRLTARDFVLIILIPLRGIAVPHFLHISSLHSDLYSHFQFPFFDST